MAGSQLKLNPLETKLFQAIKAFNHLLNKFDYIYIEKNSRSKLIIAAQSFVVSLKYFVPILITFKYTRTPVTPNFPGVLHAK
jgi:hypothetical protein